MTIPMNLRQVLSDPTLYLVLYEGKFVIRKNNRDLRNYSLNQCDIGIPPVYYADSILAMGDNLEECLMKYTQRVFQNTHCGRCRRTITSDADFCSLCREFPDQKIIQIDTEQI